MGHFDRRSVTLDEPQEGRRPGSRFGDRLARTFSRFDRATPDREMAEDPEYPIQYEQALPWDEARPRFPMARQGYDCTAVDEHVAGLERELAELDRELGELRRRVPSRGEVAAEIERIGEQTSAILIAAHDQARETTRVAEAQADRCMEDAAAQAVAVTSEANLHLRELESETVAVLRERERLLEDIRGVATALGSLADGAAQRFPPGSAHAKPLPVAASKPADEPADS